MANNNNNKTLNVPNKRFPEFSGEWKRTTAAEVCFEFKSGKGLKAENISSEGLYPVFGGNGLRGYTNTFNHDGFYVLIGRQGALCGNINITDGQSYITEHAIAVQADSENETKFFQYLFLKMNLGQFSDQSAQPGLAVNKLLKLPFYLPSKQEQLKIANLLALLDERIATQNKIIEDLKKLKSAIIDRIFCYPKENEPSVRLNKYSKKWALVKLSDITERVKTKNMASQCSQVLTIAAQYGLVSQTSFFNKSVASENLSGYFLLQKGDFAYNKSYSGEYPWGTIKRLELYTQGVLSPLYICFKINEKRVCSDYLAHYYESKKWYKGIANIAGEGARNHGLLNISVGDFFNTTHRIPDTNEQNSIAIILNKISTKLKIEQKYIQLYLEQRNYLLQQMFI